MASAIDAINLLLYLPAMYFPIHFVLRSHAGVISFGLATGKCKREKFFALPFQKRRQALHFQSVN